MAVRVVPMLKHASTATPARDPANVEWVTAPAPVAYEAALEVMDARAAAIADGNASECVWFLEHPPLFTAGTSAKDEELLDPRAATPIMAPASALLMSWLIFRPVAATCARMLPPSRPG